MPEIVAHMTLQTAVMFGLSKGRLAGRRLTEDERRILAAAVVEHFKLCRWDVMANPETVPKAPGVAMHRMPPAPR